MRVLYCTAPSTALLGVCGGVRRLMQLYEEGLKARGHEVEYLSIWQKPDWGKHDLCHLFSANGNTFSIGAMISERLPLVVSPILDKSHPDILLRLNVLLDRYAPVVYTHLGRCAALCSMADVICLMSTEEGRRVANGLGIHTPSQVVHAAVASSNVKPEAGRFGEYENRPYVLFVGDAGNPRKNAVRLIQAVQGIDTDILLCGSISQGKTGDQVRRQILQAPNVQHIGFIEEGEKAFLMQHARAFVLPSLFEGIGLAAVEAALLDTTVVVTRNGGPPDYFADKAYYVNPYSVSDIRCKIQQAKDHHLNASKWICQHVSLEHTGKELAACYEQCIENGRERIKAKGKIA